MFPGGGLTRGFGCPAVGKALGGGDEGLLEGGAMRTGPDPVEADCFLGGPRGGPAGGPPAADAWGGGGLSAAVGTGGLIPPSMSSSSKPLSSISDNGSSGSFN